MQLYVPQQGCSNFSPTSIHRRLCQFFFFPYQLSMKQPISLQGWEVHFSVFHKGLSPFYENFRIKDFDMLRFSSQKIVNLSGTQHSSFYPESGLLLLAPDTPPFLIKKPTKIEKKVHKNKQTITKSSTFLAIQKSLINLKIEKRKLQDKC